MTPISPSICGKCKQAVKTRSYLTCNVCKLSFHIECVGCEKRFYIMEKEHKCRWKCLGCCDKKLKSNEKTLRPTVDDIAVAPGGSHETCDSEPKRTTWPPLHESPCGDVTADFHDSYENITLREKPQQCSPSSSPKPVMVNKTTNVGLKEYIAEQMKYLGDQLISKIDTLTSALQSFNIRMCNFEDRLLAIEGRLDQEDAPMQSNLMVTIDQLKAELNDRDQELLSNDLEISGVPETAGENPVHIATLVGSKLGVPIDSHDVVSAVRAGVRRDAAAAAPGGGAGASTAPRVLVVRLLRRAQRDEVLQAARVRRGADTADFGLPVAARRFYVNERLTRFNRQLFRRAREQKQRAQWKFVWTKNGAIFARRDQGEPITRIRTEKDLNKVFSIVSVSGS